MKFYSHGKLLITGEYLILKGAKALAAPVRFGQELQVSDNTANEYLTWESFEHDRMWFHAEFDTAHSKIVESSDDPMAQRLLTWLLAAEQLNPGFFKKQRSRKVITKADFDLSWGLGSSSSLISNIAWWADVNSFHLHKFISKGSGYDVVCARENGPVFFTLGKEDSYTAENATFFPPFAGQIYFIYLGRKQDSALSVDAFMNAKNSMFDQEIKTISDLTHRIAFAETIYEFEEYIREHEQIISSVLHKKRLKEERFPEMKGEIKSLGAWGGDFAMMTWHDSVIELKKYLATKSIDTVFTFNELILSR